MNDTIAAALFCAASLSFVLCSVAIAKSFVTKNVTTSVTVVRVNGQKVTQDVGRVLSWSLTNGEMRLEYEPDSVFSDGFGDETR